MEDSKEPEDRRASEEQGQREGICKINDEAPATSCRLVRPRLMRISRISDRPPAAFVSSLIPPTSWPPSPINPFSRRATEWRRGNSGCRFPRMEFSRRDATLLVRRVALPGRWFSSAWIFSHVLAFPSFFSFFFCLVSLVHDRYSRNCRSTPRVFKVTKILKNWSFGEN